jgi:hypothetical protein
VLIGGRGHFPRRVVLDTRSEGAHPETIRSRWEPVIGTRILCVVDTAGDGVYVDLSMY